MTPRQARRLVRDAFAAGVEWCGVNGLKGAPMIGCTPEAGPRANEMLSRVIDAWAQDHRAINRALWNYVTKMNPKEASTARRMVQALCNDLDANERRH